MQNRKKPSEANRYEFAKKTDKTKKMRSAKKRGEFVKMKNLPIASMCTKCARGKKNNQATKTRERERIKKMIRK